MPKSLAIFAALGFLSLLLVGAAWGLALNVTPEHRRGGVIRWLLAWTLKGFFGPALIWTVMNFGVSFAFQPFDPAVQAAKLNNSARYWVPEFLRASSDGWFIAATYWGALTLAWVLWLFRCELEGESRGNFRTLCLMSAVGMLLPVLGLVYLGGPGTLGFAGILILGPIAIGAPSVIPKRADRPMYSRAIAKMKFGKYSEAEWEIIRQLERHEDDFEGWLMMAGLYAEHFHDMGEAEQTILELCDQRRTTNSQISIALQKLADWHLKYGGDPDAAGRALQMICNRLPGTHLAHMAEVRLRQLPKSREELHHQQHPEPIHLPPADVFTPDLRSLQWLTDPDEAAGLANEQVAVLQSDPNDVVARERLARLLAEQLHQPDQAIEQLALLLNLPDQPDMKRAEWLALTATWHLHYRHDEHTGRRALERLVQEFPGSPLAFAARRRLQTP